MMKFNVRIWALALALPALLVACGESKSEEEIQKEAQELADKLNADLKAGTEGYVLDDKEGGFMVTFPAEPQKSVENVDTEIGPIKMTIYMYESGSTIYMLAYSDYPADLVKQSDPYTLLHAGKDGGFGSFNAKIRDEKEYKYKDKYPALRVMGDNKADGLYIYAKYVMVGNRFYQIMKGKEGEYADPDKTDSFFTSFDIAVK